VTVYLDTNIVIYFVEQNPVWRAKVIAWEDGKLIGGVKLVKLKTATTGAATVGRIYTHCGSMIRPTWLLEANVTGLPSEQLQAEIRRQGMHVHVVKYFPASARPRDILGGEHLPMDAFVLFIGTWK
jgi:hypothetical protein